MLNREYLCQELYRLHQKRVDVDDPIFMNITLSDLVLSHYVERFQLVLQEQAGQYADQIKKQATEHRELSVKQANAILDALNNDFSNGEQQFRKALTEVGNNQVAAIREAGKKEIQNISNSIKFLQGSLLLGIAIIFFLLGTLFKIYFP